MRGLGRAGRRRGRPAGRGRGRGAAPAAPRTDVTLAGARVSWLVPVLGLSLVAAAVAYVAGIAVPACSAPGWRPSSGWTEVLFAVLFAWLLLGQLPRPVQLVGGLLVVAGIALVRLGERAEAAGSPEVPQLAAVES